MNCAHFLCIFRADKQTMQAELGLRNADDLFLLHFQKLQRNANDRTKFLHQNLCFSYNSRTGMETLPYASIGFFAFLETLDNIKDNCTISSFTFSKCSSLSTLSLFRTFKCQKCFLIALNDPNCSQDKKYSNISFKRSKCMHFVQKI